MLRDTRPATKNTTHVATLPTAAECRIWHDLQSALVAAAMKVLDSKVGESITDIQVQRGGPPTTTHYGASLLTITLSPVDNDPRHDSYIDSPVITLTMKLGLPRHPNPEYNPDEPEQYDY